MVPLATLITYSLIFAVVFGAVPPDFGNGAPGSYPLWLFCGLAPWSFFLISINTSIPTLLASGPILQKVYFPSYVPIVGSTTTVLVQTLIEFSILGLALLLAGNVGPTWLLFPFWLVIFVTFVTSIAIALSILNVFYRDVAHLVTVALPLLFFLTPIIYDVTSIPTEWHGVPIRAIVEFNPLAGFVGVFRSLLYDLDAATPSTWIGLLLWAGGAATAAIVAYRRWGLDIGEAV